MLLCHLGVTVNTSGWVPMNTYCEREPSLCLRSHKIWGLYVTAAWRIPSDSAIPRSDSDAQPGSRLTEVNVLEHHMHIHVSVGCIHKTKRETPEMLIVLQARGLPGDTWNFHEWTCCEKLYSSLLRVTPSPNLWKHNGFLWALFSSLWIWINSSWFYKEFENEWNQLFPVFSPSHPCRNEPF